MYMYVSVMVPFNANSNCNCIENTFFLEYVKNRQKSSKKHLGGAPSMLARIA